MSSGTNTISLPLRTGWRLRWNHWLAGCAASRMLGGSVIMLLGSILVAAINFGFNVSMARLLGPALFAQVAAVVTLLMLASAVSLSFQMVCAKFVARNPSASGKLLVFHGLRKRAWIVGAMIALALTATQRPIADYLRMPNSWLLAVFALGMAFTPLSVCDVEACKVSANLGPCRGTIFLRLLPSLPSRFSSWNWDTESWERLERSQLRYWLPS